MTRQYWRLRNYRNFTFAHRNASTSSQVDLPPANDEDLENASKVATEEAPLSSQRKTRESGIEDLQLIDDTCGSELR